jgi:hypothetical protein
MKERAGLLAKAAVQELQTMSDGAIALLSAVDESLAKSCC